MIKLHNNNNLKTFVPYTYLIRWSQTKKYYYGSQYGQHANPKNLWSKYFTSSKIVKKYRMLFGEPDMVKIRKTFTTKEHCLLWENRVLKKIIKDPNCLNISANLGVRAVCTAGFVTVKDELGNTLSVTKDHPDYVSGKLKHIRDGLIVVRDPNTNKVLSVRKDDNRFLSGELISINKCNNPPNQTGKIWVNDGIKNKYITKNELAFVLTSGYVRGKLQKPPTRDYSSVPSSQLGTCWICHPIYRPKK